jgi:hypothetical protein
MEQYIKEVKRLQQLAGIKEMRLNEPGSSNEIKIDGNFTYEKQNANNLYKHIRRKFPDSKVTIGQCKEFINSIEENTAQDREDEGEEMELISWSIDDDNLAEDIEEFVKFHFFSPKHMFDDLVDDDYDNLENIEDLDI